MTTRYFMDTRSNIFILLILSLPLASDSAERMIHHDLLHADGAGIGDSSNASARSRGG
jgi:hypothetical protein